MKTLSIAVALSLLLSGCGEKADTPTPPAPSVKTSTVAGVIDAASVYDMTLNGHTYPTQDAEASYQGRDYNVTSVKKGMAVTVQLENDKAADIQLDPAFTGLAVLNPDNQLLMNGATIRIPDPSVFTLDYKYGGGSLGWVMVFAHLDENNQWVVTNVSPIDAMPNAEMEGKITGLTDTQFHLDGATIHYTASDVTGGKPLANGMYVQALGQFVNDSLTANRIDIKS
ncbi:DUF5666 domain-containing protein [Photobacterium aphoticum]|uniref:DUF5666 domain-containing protein n=1 Tax=Photobacterium aphoticum TaxID=754436 RepID=A0A0J1GKK0_9GAMM|nr:DUF5666 domain-containing protein [Photobacterium aphoticum]KLV00230.1 hypothetical protein ABT58_14720 [Photobacterium aphoticum]PSU56599.1 hypothetical protein C9I90_12425 [Photobacterium aphoticum]GHA55897.1 hypothetical protein GCM10007086_32380 [Photobacterium aphoticum]